MKVLDKLNKQGFLTLDGSMGACLIKQNIDTRKIVGLSIENPQMIKNVHTGYLKAGCDIILTNSFSVNEINLKYNGITNVMAAKASVSIAKECASQFEDRFVAYDVGPSGNVPMDMASMRSWEYYAKFFDSQVKTAIDSGCDLIMAETMFSSFEALSVLKIAKSYSPKTPVFISMTFNKKGRSSMGDKLMDSLKMFIAEGADAVGLNCSITPEEMLPLVVEAKDAVGEIPLIAQPNRGEPKTDENLDTYYEMSSDDFALGTKKLHDAGADIIGGCCGSDKECMEKLVALVK